MNKKNSILISVGILVVLGGLGALIFFGASGPAGYNNPSPTPLPNPSPAPLPQPVPPTTWNNPDIKEVLKHQPGANATQDQIIAFDNYVNQVAIVSSTVDVSGCALNPSVVKATKGDTLTFKNSDNVSHTLDNPNWTLTVGAESSATLKVSGGGAQGYNCDRGNPALTSAGIIYVAQ